jgi:PAP2 superfamily
MRSNRFVRRSVSLGAVIALAAVAAFVPGAPAAAQVNEVTNWNRIAVTTLTAFPGPGGGAPPASQIHMGMVQGAVYDAVMSIERRYEPYLLEATFPATASKEAAVATAAHEALSDIIESVPNAIAFPNEATLQTTIDAAYAISLAAIPNGPSEDAGIAAGMAAADAMDSAREGDGRFGPSPWVPNHAPGHWQPLVDPVTNLPLLDPTPWVGEVEPFLMKTSFQFRTDGPNALTSAAYAEEFNEVKALGSATSTVRTEEQTHIARFWQSTPVATWNAVARTLAVDPDYELDLVDSARLFAMQNLAGADSSINCWNDKYYWDFWRPWNAITRADEDGNRATKKDASWKALITAPYPDHPSGHLCLDGVHLKVLRTVFGSDKIAFEVTSVQFPGEVRTYDRFSHALKEIIDARVWAGLHFRTADVQARVLGRKIAHFAAKNYFEPLD